jgi:hypothetical protein
VRTPAADPRQDGFGYDYASNSPASFNDPTGHYYVPDPFVCGWDSLDLISCLDNSDIRRYLHRTHFWTCGKIVNVSLALASFVPWARAARLGAQGAVKLERALKIAGLGFALHGDIC